MKLPLNSHCFYSNSTYVLELDLDSFNKLVLNSTDIWIVQFYVKKSPYCMKFIQEYEKAGKALKDFVKLGALNVGKATEIIQKYDLNEYPKIKIFNHVENEMFDYSFKDEYTARGIALDAVKAIRKQIDNGLKNRINAKGVINLDDENFEKFVLNSEDVWVVVFYDTDSNELYSLETTLVAVVEEMPRVKIGAVSSENLYTRSMMDIHQLPNVVFLPFGFQTKKAFIRFDAPITKRDLLEFVRLQYTKLPVIKPTGLTELEDEDHFDALCEKAHLCILIFLPDLKTFSHAKRQEYYNMFNEELDTGKYSQWVWLWCEFGKFPNLEIILGIDETSDPIISAIEIQYRTHVLLKGPFDIKQFEEFLENARVGTVEEEHVFVDDIYSDSYIKDEL